MRLVNYSTITLGGSRWSQAPPVMPVNCPPGLEYLASVGQIYVKQCIELFESNENESWIFVSSFIQLCFLLSVATGVETENRYELVDNFGNRIYMAMEGTALFIIETEHEKTYKHNDFRK